MTWADVQTGQARAVSLGARMKSIAGGEADAIKADAKAADGKDAVKHTTAARLASAHGAAQGQSHAVATMRSKAAKAIEPEKVPAPNTTSPLSFHPTTRPMPALGPF